MRAGDAWSYRTLPPATSGKFMKISQGIMTFTWWWIFYGAFQVWIFFKQLIL